MCSSLTTSSKAGALGHSAALRSLDCFGQFLSHRAVRFRSPPVWQGWRLGHEFSVSMRALPDLPRDT